MRKMRSLLSLGILLAGVLPLRAQFYTSGNEGPRIRWNTISTDAYRFIYPQGCDSLARAYALSWEQSRHMVGASNGFAPNCAYTRRMPVILHPYLGYSNGMVVWTPRRMEMYTGPSMYSPEPLPWMDLLSIHENRHVSQMQYIHTGRFRVYSYLVGEIPASLSVLYTEPSWMEGDAVAAETGLSNSGRGRTADFLEYYRACAQEGITRSYWQWRYGSQKWFTPDYYKVGYLMMGGSRTCLGAPQILKTHYAEVGRHPLRSWEKTLKDETGYGLEDGFDAIIKEQTREWGLSADARKPFMPSERITEPEERFVEYRGLVAGDGEEIYMVRSSMTDPLSIVRLDLNSRELQTIGVTSAASRLEYGDGSLFWSAAIPDLRWEMESSSEIRKLDSGKPAKRVTKFAGARHQRYANPVYSGTKTRYITACETPSDGSSVVSVFDESGTKVQSYVCPSGMLAYECIWVDDKLYIAALTDEGEGIWRVDNGFEPLIDPSPVKINHLSEFEGNLSFVSDRTGVNEMYVLHDSEVFQITNLIQGGQDFTHVGEYLYYTVLSSSGRMVFRTPIAVLPRRKVDFDTRYTYRMAEALSAQELSEGAFEDIPDSIAVSDPRPYRKALHLLKIHSWAPVYIDADDLASLSYSSVTTRSLLGATVMFQNDLGTLNGSVGYSLADGFSGHLTYSGLYPVFEAKFSRNYSTVRSYIPLNFSSDGWLRAIIPNASASLYGGQLEWQMGVRGYIMQSTPSANIYPKFGVGAEFGISGALHPYYFLYAYLPGFYPTHGFNFQVYSNPSSAATSMYLNYAMPILPVDSDWLSPFVYVRNFELIPFWRLVHSETVKMLPLNANSVGASFAAVLGNLWRIPYDMHIGLRYTYRIDNLEPHMFETVLSVDL